MRKAPVFVGVAALGVAAAVAYGVGGDSTLPFVAPEPVCTAAVGGHTVELSVEQAGNASLIAAISVQRGMPARAASIALATAYQESKLYNLEYGDRDSLGLFQQRPSQGWGTAEEVRDPTHATNAFYDALDRLDYESLEITVAAQEVQHSAFPGAYADHEQDARTLASALTGNSAHAFTCTLDDEGTAGSPRAVRRETERVFGVTVRKDAGSLEVATPSGATGWAVAHYLVGQADRLGVRSVRYDGRVWRAGTDDGWQREAADDSSVHVEVA